MGTATAGRPGGARAAVATGWLPAALVLLLLPVAAVTPLLEPGLPETHDAWLHIFRAVQLEACLAEGDWYPRWAPDFAQGLGYPIFNYYAPLAYYVLVGLHWLGLSFVVAFKALQAGIFLLFGVGMYLFARDLLGERGALVAAAAYAYAPYHFSDAYVRGDVAEFLALAFFPFVLWRFRCLVLRPGPLNLVWAVLPYAGLMLSHNLSAFFFTPVLLAYLALLVLARRSRRAMAFAVAALGLGLGISAFYWFPALAEKDLVQIERTLVPPFFDLHNNFVSLATLLGPQPPIDQRLLNPEVPARLGTHLLVLALLGLVAAARRLVGEARLTVVMAGGLTAVLVFLMTEASGPFWDLLPLVSFIQFPWRLLGIASLGLALLAGAASCWLPAVRDEGRWWPSWVATGALVVVVIAPSLVYLYPAERDLRFPEPTIADAVAFELDSAALGTTAGEYLPLTVETFLEPSPMRQFYEGAGPKERLNRPALPAGVQAELLAHRGGYDAYRIAAATPTTVLFNVYYFLYWHAYVDGVEVETWPYEPYGLVTFTVPAGEHLVELRREHTLVENAASATSAFTGLVLLAALALGIYRLRRRTGGTRPQADTAAPAAGFLVVGVAVLALLAAKALVIDNQSGWLRLSSPPDAVLGVQQPLSVRLGGQVECLGYDIDATTVRPEETLEVRVYWQPATELEVDYSVFLHLTTSPSVPPVAQQDSLHPGHIPTSRWRPGKYVVSTHRLVVPGDLAPGEYKIITGLYDPRPGGQRLRPDGAGEDVTYVELATISVEPPSR